MISLNLNNHCCLGRRTRRLPTSMGSALSGWYETCVRWEARKVGWTHFACVKLWPSSHTNVSYKYQCESIFIHICGICVQKYINVYSYVYVYTCMYRNINIFICICTCTYTNASVTSKSLNIYVHMGTHAYTYTFTNTHTYTCTYRSTYTYTYAFSCPCTCTCTCTYTHIFLHMLIDPNGPMTSVGSWWCTASMLEMDSDHTLLDARSTTW